MKLVTTVFIATVVLCNCKTIDVKKTTLTTNTNEGSVYNLPKTQLLFEINLKTTTYTLNPQGCYKKYKNYFRGVVSPALLDKLDSLPPKNQLVTSKVASAVISPVPVIDENKSFTIKMKNKGTFKHVYGLSMDDNGILNKGEFSSENQVIPVVSQLISSAAGFASPFMLTRSSDNDSIMKAECDNLFEKYTELHNEKSEFVFLAPFKNASQLPNKEIYDRVLSEFEKDKMTLFTQLMFSTDIQLDKIVIRYTPSTQDSEIVKGKILFGFRKNANQPEIHINKDLVGPPNAFVIGSPGVKIIESNEATLNKDTSIKKYYLKIIPASANRSTLLAIQNTPSNHIKEYLPDSNSGGIVYNIPMNCKVYLQEGINNNWTEASIMIPQWGTIARLSNKSANQVIEMNPLYGNLRSIKEQNQNVSPDQIKSLGESLYAARDVFYTDPITKMERRIKFLETKEKLTEAEGTELTKLRSEIEILKAQKEALEIKQALKDFDQ